jgi:hypothetical protein
MKNLALCVSGLLFAASAVSAQVTVEVTLEQEQFLPGESIPAVVRITNRSGQTLEMGKDDTWLTFSVESPNGFVVSKKDEVPVKEEFTLESSKVAKVSVDLAPYFTLPQPGPYNIRATVTIREWSRQVNSPPKHFDLIEGAKLWEQEVGLPLASGDSDKAPELRKYTLHQANYLKKQLMLYIQITDHNGKVYKVFPIGPMLSFSHPEPQIDKFSNLHVLYQDGPHSFSYNVINPYGSLLTRQTYDFTTRPRLRLDSEGNLTIVGGTRRITSRDLPPSDTAETNAEKPKP